MISDPEDLTAPFKMAFPWTRNEKYELFEYACHEGNIQLRGFITSTSPRFAKQREAAFKAIAGKSPRTDRDMVALTAAEQAMLDGAVRRGRRQGDGPARSAMPMRSAPSASSRPTISPACPAPRRNG